MKKTNILLLIATALLTLSACQKQTKESYPTALIDYVNPFIGTDYHGHTYPGATSPYGMVQLSPDTRWEGWDACSGYHYSDDQIYGFAHTHLSGTGATDLSDLLFYPSNSFKEVWQNIEATNLPPQKFSHDNEAAHAGYYTVTLNNEIKVELTTTPRVGVHRYTFPEESERVIAIDLYCIKRNQVQDAHITLVNDRELSGWVITNGWAENQKVYFHIRFDQPITSHQLFQKETDRGPMVRGYFAFDGNATQTVEAYAALSLTSVEAAERNLTAELQHTDNFDTLRERNEQVWEQSLSKIQIKAGGTLAERETFYTALYHSLIVPNLTNDVDSPNRYSTFSLWDTYRAWHPLMTLLDHQLVGDMVESMLEMYDQWGELPIWPLYQHDTKTMIGYHAVSVIADAYLRGIWSRDPQAALAAMVHSSNINEKGSRFYTEMGYIPANRARESVSCTLEYSYDDWCIALMARALGDDATYQIYRERAMNYAKVFDPSTMFFRGRKEDGTWITPFKPAQVSRDFTEANAWQYRFAAQHDIYGMAQLFGGIEPLRQAVDHLFNDTEGVDGDLVDITGVIGQYAHGNEPSHHIAYLYAYLQAPWQTEQLTRQLLSDMYSNQPDGIIGNEDCGQMSAWYILSALGFYSVTPASGEFVLTTPLFEEVSMQLANGKILTIKANDPQQNRYIDRVMLNGVELPQLFITYDQLMEGGTIEYILRPEPNKERAKLQAPYSLTEEPFPSTPYPAHELTYFDEYVELDLKCATPEATIYYALDGAPFHEYVAPITLTRSGQVTTYAQLPNGATSPRIVLQAIKAKYLQPYIVKADQLTNGVNYRYYTGGNFDDSVRHLERLGTLSDSGTMEAVTIERSPQPDFFGYIFTGYLHIAERGVYDFLVASDDGSTLTIADQLIVDNDGSHAVVHGTGRVALEAGYFPFELRYYQGDQGKGLSFRYKKATEEEYTDTPTYIRTL